MWVIMSEMGCRGGDKLDLHQRAKVGRGLQARERIDADIAGHQRGVAVRVDAEDGVEEARPFRDEEGRDLVGVHGLGAAPPNLDW